MKKLQSFRKKLKSKCLLSLFVHPTETSTNLKNTRKSAYTGKSKHLLTFMEILMFLKWCRWVKLSLIKTLNNILVNNLLTKESSLLRQEIWSRVLNPSISKDSENTEQKINFILYMVYEYSRRLIQWILHH